LRVYKNQNVNTSRGKEEQFLSGFRKRGSEKGSAVETRQDGFKPKPTANIATITDEVEQTFTLMTLEETTFKVPHIPVSVPSKTPNDDPFPSSHNYMHQGMGMEGNKGLPRERSLVLHTDFHNKQTIHTLIDSGTSDHCFADKSFFISYSPLNQNISGLSASINSTFNILGRETVNIKTRVEGTLRSITLDNAMYIPDL